jgi:hypothetical protein
MSLPSTATAQYLDFFGQSGISMEDAGTLVTDRAHLATCTATLRIRRDQWNGSDMNTLGNIGASHPIFTFVTMENRELSIQGPWAYAKCKYAGIESQYSINGTPPQYELIIGVSESPIATHTKFNQTNFAGTPMAPKNGANFRSVRFPNSVASETSPSLTSAFFVFDSFDVFTGGATPALNPFAGVTSYLEANMTWRKSWKMDHYPTASDINHVGDIDGSPPQAPTLNSPRTWLNMGVSCSHQRGSAYFWTQEWRASGRRGWNTVIYDHYA